MVLILSLHILATINHWYWTYSWFDIPMHFLGGFWVAMLFFWFYQKTRNYADYTQTNADNNMQMDTNKFPRESASSPRMSVLLTIVSCLSFVALIGVFWEFFEFLYDVFISSRGYSGFMQLGAADMIGDLFFDLLGGLTFSIIYIYKIFNRR